MEYFQSRWYSLTGVVIPLLAIFVFGFNCSVPVNCKCPSDFTYAQCNYTNRVCGLRSAFKQPPFETKRFSNIHCSETTPDCKLEYSENYMPLYDWYPFLLIIVTVLLYLPHGVWSCKVHANDLTCISNTVMLGFAHPDDQNIRDKLIKDIRTFLLFCKGQLYITAFLVHAIRPAVCVLILQIFNFVLGTGFSSYIRIQTLASVKSLHEISQTVFPLRVLCSFQVVTDRTPSWSTVECYLPTNHLLQILTTMIILWMTFLVAAEIFTFCMFIISSRPSKQKQFYINLGVEVDQGIILQRFGNDGFLLFSMLKQLDRRGDRLLTQVINGLLNQNND